MKRIIQTVLMLMLVGVAYSATNKLKVQDISLAPGGNVTLNIELENELENLMGWQCDITLPAGLSLELNNKNKPVVKLGNRFSTTGHTVSSSVLQNGSYRIIVTSLDGDAIPDHSGTLFSVNLLADASVSVGATLQGAISKIEFNTLDNQRLILNDVSIGIIIGGGNTPSIDITKYISAGSTGSTIMQANNLINSGSQLSWCFSNGSTVDVILKSMQLIDGQTGMAGNIVDVNTVVEAGKAANYTTTIGTLGIHTPVTCRFRYEYNGVEYSADAIYSSNLTLLIKAFGNGSVIYSGSAIKNTSKSFSVDSCASVILSFTPDNGYRIKVVKVNNEDVTSNVSSNRYSISVLTRDTSVEVEFEAIPVTYTLSITALGNGSVYYDDNIINSATKNYSLNEGTSATLTFTPNSGYRIGSLKVNNVDVTSSISNKKYTVNSIERDTNIEVVFEKESNPDIHSKNVQYMNLTVKNHAVSFALADKPVLTYKNDVMLVSTNRETIQIQLADLQNWTFSDIATGMIDVRTAKQRLTGGCAYLTQLKPGSQAEVFDMKGNLVLSETVNEFGESQLDYGSLPKGVYVIKTSVYTIKITNK